MSGKKIEIEAREKIVIDMNDFLITYAKTILGPVPDLAQKIYAAGKNDITGLDQLFNDSGYGRNKNTKPSHKVSSVTFITPLLIIPKTMSIN